MGGSVSGSLLRLQTDVGLGCNHLKACLGPEDPLFFFFFFKSLLSLLQYCFCFFYVCFFLRSLGHVGP